jgi:hypothetical protein
MSAPSLSAAWLASWTGRARIVAATTAEFERRHGFPLTPMRGGLSVAATRPRLCADCLKLDLDARTLTFIEP